YAPQVAELLKESDRDVRSSAARALGAMGAAAKEYAPQVAELLKDSDSNVRSSAADGLLAMGPSSNSLLFWRVLLATYSYPEEKYDRRIDAYLLTSEDPNHSRCVSWLGDRSSDRSKGELRVIRHLTKDETKVAIDALKLALPDSTTYGDEFDKL